MKGNKLIKICLVTAVSGILLTGIGVMLGGRVYGISLGRNGLNVNSNLRSEEGNKYGYIDENKNLEPFKNLDMNISFADVRIQESDHFGMEYHVREDRKIIEEHNGDTLRLSQNKLHGDLTLFSLGDISLGDSRVHEYVTVFLPKGEQLDSVILDSDSGDMDLGDLKSETLTVDCSFGKVKTKKLDVKNADFDSDSGDIQMDEINANQLTIKDSFGSIKINKAKVTGEFNCKSDSGDTNVLEIDANDIQMHSSFGTIKSKIMTAENIVLESDSGDCNVDNISAQSIQINSQFGSVNVGLREKVTGYNCDVDTKFGSVKANKEDMGDRYKNIDSNSNRLLTISCDSGDVKLYDAK